MFNPTHPPARLRQLTEDIEPALIIADRVHLDLASEIAGAACAVIEGKDSANRKLSKNKSSGRIDGMVALAMAFGVAPIGKPIDINALIA